jgi:hypothetical protein
MLHTLLGERVLASRYMTDAVPRTALSRLLRLTQSQPPALNTCIHGHYACHIAHHICITACRLY